MISEIKRLDREMFGDLGCFTGVMIRITAYVLIPVLIGQLIYAAYALWTWSPL